MRVVVRRFLPCLAAPIALLLVGNVDPGTIPPQLRAMLDAAMASGNDGEVATVAKYAALAAPDAAAEIARLADGWRVERRDAAARALAQAGFGELLKGRAELGGFATTGNTSNIGVTASIELKREGPRWRHKWRALAEYQESAGVASREHYLLAWEPNLKVDDRLYAYGAAQFESDRYLGYTSRYSASTGAGYTAVKTPSVSLDVELGPAFRATTFTDDMVERNLAARGSLDFDWRLAPGLTLSQDASAYLQSANSTLNGRTALAARLFGPLSAQLSYAVNHETRPAEGRKTTDTTSRASLVYAF